MFSFFVFGIVFFFCRSLNTTKEFLQYANELDKLEGLLDWRRDPESKLYNYKLIVQRLQSLRKQKVSILKGQPIDELISELRSGLLRNLGGILAGSKKILLNEGRFFDVSNFIFV